MTLLRIAAACSCANSECAWDAGKKRRARGCRSATRRLEVGATEGFRRGSAGVETAAPMESDEFAPVSVSGADLSSPSLAVSGWVVARATA